MQRGEGSVPEFVEPHGIFRAGMSPKKRAWAGPRLDFGGATVLLRTLHDSHLRFSHRENTLGFSNFSLGIVSLSPGKLAHGFAPPSIAEGGATRGNNRIISSSKQSKAKHSKARHYGHRNMLRRNRVQQGSQREVRRDSIVESSEQVQIAVVMPKSNPFLT